MRSPSLFIFTLQDIDNMKNTMFIAVIALACIFSATTYGQKKKSSKKKKSSRNPQLVVAIRQSIMLPGNTQSSPEAKFILIWNEMGEPGGFCWRDTESWKQCDINKATNYNKKNYRYTSALLTSAIKAGDTLELAPMNGVKGAIPDAIQDGRDNVLYYQLPNGIWKGIPVSNFEELTPEIIPVSEFK